MQLFITILHVMLSLALILIILLQPGKEGAAVFGGGGGNQAYGPRGQANFLGRATTLVAAMFMVTSITLAYRSSTRTQAGTGNLDEVMQEGLELDEVPMLTPPAGTATDATPPPPTGDAPEGPVTPAEDQEAADAPPPTDDAGAAPEGEAVPVGGTNDAPVAETPAAGPSPETPPEARTQPAEGANP